MDDYVSAEEHCESADVAYEAVEGAVEAASRALKEVDGACKATPEGGAVGTRIAHEAVTVALVELHDALIALETI